MPSAYTHLSFARDILAESKDLDIVSKPMYWTGAQGPDMLFFSHMGVMPGTLHRYGNLLHSLRIEEAFAYFYEHCKEDPRLMSYLYGYMTHYGLDCRTHALIVSASLYEHEKTGFSAGTIHVRMETQIDTWMMNENHRDSLGDIYHSMHISEEEKDLLADLYAGLFQEVYGLEVEKKRISGALDEMNMWARLARPHPIGEKAMFGGEFLISSPKSLHHMIHDADSDWPILNSAHKAVPCWYDPDTTMSTSIKELMAEGKAIALDMIHDPQHLELRYTFMGRPLHMAIEPSLLQPEVFLSSHLAEV